MSSHRKPGARGTRTRAPLRIGLLGAVLLCGCTTGGPPAATTGSTPATRPPTTQSAATPVPATTPTGAPTAPPGPTAPLDPPTVAAPPGAGLTPVAGEAVTGELGGFTWAGTGSDSPWLVAPPDQAIHAPGPYAVTFVPPLATAGWTARWAPIAGGAAGDPAVTQRGGPGPVVLRDPGAGGAWSLQLDVRFAAGGRAAYYWRIEPAP